MIDLTPAEKRLLARLQQRQALGLPTWTCHARRSRAVIVGRDFPEPSSRMRAVARSSRNTVIDLVASGLLEQLGDTEDLGGYIGWRHGDAVMGERLSLTLAGIGTCSTCGAQGDELCTTVTGRDHARRRTVITEEQA